MAATLRIRGARPAHAGLPKSGWTATTCVKVVGDAASERLPRDARGHRPPLDGRCDRRRRLLDPRRTRDRAGRPRASLEDYAGRTQPRNDEFVALVSPPAGRLTIDFGGALDTHVSQRRLLSDPV